jgi:uncharacterized membrane protein
VPSLADLRAEEDETKLGDALRTLFGVFQEPPEAVIVLSDGQVGDTPELIKVAEDYRTLGIPIHVLAMGDEAIRGDIAIERLSVPRKVNAGDQVPIRVAVRSQGFDGQRVKLEVHSASDPQTKPVAELPITLTGGSQSHDIVVSANPNLGELTLSVALQENEAIESNNRVPFEVMARDRKVQVFYMEGTTHGREYAFLRDALQDDPNIKCVTATVDDQWVSRPRITRINDPYRGFPASRAELFEYDVVICSDISRGAFTREQLEWTGELVRDRGGGFVMVGGHTSFGAGAWDQTIWDQLIPIDMKGGRIGQGFVNQTFRVNVPAAVRTHPIWRISEDPAENDRIIDALPPFHGTNIAERVKPAATLLGVSASRLTVVGTSPVFACQSYGRGRTFAMLPDTTEAWGHDFERYWGQNDNRYFRKFWRNVVNWLTENSVSAQRRLVVDTDKLIYRPGEPIKLSVQAYDDQYQSITGYHVVARLLDNADDKTVAAADLAVRLGKYEGSINARLPQVESDEEASTLAQLTVEIVAQDRDREIAKQQVKLQVLNDSDELLTPNPNRKPLEELAETTDGMVLKSAADVVAALSGIKSPPGKRVVHRAPVWDHPMLWMGMLGLMVTEWIMRRRFGA